MCYSILIETDLKRLGIDFHADVDIEAFLRIYELRAQGTPNVHVPRGIDANFAYPETPAEKKAKELIDRYTAQKSEELRAALSKKEAQIIELEEKLKKKWYKTHAQNLETARRVLEKTQLRLARLTAPYAHGSHDDSRALQYSYAPLVVLQGGKRVIRPFRYQLRSRSARTEPNREINMYNARIETLEERPAWKPLFMENHGVLAYRGFYEWVPHPDTGKTAEIFFYPKSGQSMWAPALYDHFEGNGESIDSFAIITSDPPPEVERMGHDRCPVHPPRDFVSDWLNPKSCTRDYIKRRLLEKEPVEYVYSWPERL